MDFEKAFSDFLETSENDKAEQALFELTRAAFRAGWQAAQRSSQSPKIITLKSNEAE